MAQAFVSTYRNHYRGIQQKKTELIKPDIIGKSLPDNDRNLWILVEEDCEGSENLAKAYAKIKALEKKRNRSVYQVSYCTDPNSSSSTDFIVSKKGSDQLRTTEQDETSDNPLLLYCDKVYGRNIEKLLPPLPTSRQIFGYIRRTRLITPLSVYQNEYGRLACNILAKKNIW